MLNLAGIKGFDPGAVQNGSNTLYVTLMGIGIVFFGLVCIVLLCIVMSAIFKAFSKVNKSNEKTPVEVAVAQEAVIENKQEFVAAVSAAIAEEMGTDVSAIRIKSIKKL